MCSVADVSPFLTFSSVELGADNVLRNQFAALRHTDHKLKNTRVKAQGREEELSVFPFFTLLYVPMVKVTSLFIGERLI